MISLGVRYTISNHGQWVSNIFIRIRFIGNVWYVSEWARVGCRFRATAWDSPKYYLIIVYWNLIFQRHDDLIISFSSIIFILCAHYTNECVTRQISIEKEKDRRKREIQSEWMVSYSMLFSEYAQRIRMQSIWMFYKWSLLLTKSTFMLLVAQQDRHQRSPYCEHNSLLKISYQSEPM